MAAVTQGQVPSVADLVVGAEHIIAGFLAGEDIAEGKLCYVKASDSLVYLATGAAANEAAGAWGMNQEAASAGEAITIYHGVVFGYKPLVGGSPAATNALLYLSTAGDLQTTASTGDAVGVVRVLDADGRIFIRCHP